MRSLLITAVTLAALAVAMVAVCEHAEVCRLRYRVWQVQQRTNSLDRQIREVEAELEQRRTPKALLEQAPNTISDGRPAARVGTRPVRQAHPGPQDGRTDLRWFEFGRGR